MSAIGGPLESVTISGRTFSVAQDSGPSTDLGGDTNTIEMNGDRTGRIVKELRPALLESVNVQIDHDNDDMQFLDDVQRGTEYVPISVTYVEGTVYSGSGTITDPVVLNSDKATAEIKLSGPGLVKQ